MRGLDERKLKHWRQQAAACLFLLLLVFILLLCFACLPTPLLLCLCFLCCGDCLRRWQWSYAEQDRPAESFVEEIFIDRGNAKPMKSKGMGSSPTQKPMKSKGMGSSPAQKPMKSKGMGSSPTQKPLKNMGMGPSPAQKPLKIMEAVAKRQDSSPAQKPLKIKGLSPPQKPLKIKDSSPAQKLKVKAVEVLANSSPAAKDFMKSKDMELGAKHQTILPPAQKAVKTKTMDTVKADMKAKILAMELPAMKGLKTAAMPLPDQTDAEEAPAKKQVKGIKTKPMPTEEAATPSPTAAAKGLKGKKNKPAARPVEAEKEAKTAAKMKGLAAKLKSARM